MAQKQNRDTMTVMDAIENLSKLAELDLPASSVEADRDLVPAYVEEHSARWLDTSHLVESSETVKETFLTIRNYLEHLYKREKGHLKDPEMQRGVQAIMILAGEAAQKLEKYTSLFKGARPSGKVVMLKEYQELQKFYLSKVVKRFEKGAALEEGWEKEWEEVKAEAAADDERASLKSLESVRRDREYELFYIRKENGRPFFNSNLLRHIRLVGEFDEAVSDFEGEDPLLKIKMVDDHDACLSAKEILHAVSFQIDEFYKEGLRHKERDFVAAVNKALMALMLCADTRNRLPSASGKSCLNYFYDFHAFLREALVSQGYKDYIAQHGDLEHFASVLINLTHLLSAWFFTRATSRKEMQEFIKRMIQSNEVGSQPVWNEFFADDERMRSLLKKYPSGPLLKTLDLFREGGEHSAFDPLAQGNLPSQLYTFAFNESHLTVLRLPAPVRQEMINQVEIAPEFIGFLRALRTQLDGQRLLLFNLQDRTSWQEHARCVALEKLQNEAEFTPVLTVVTIAKNTEFYHQTGPYQTQSDAAAFIASFKDQVASGETSGFFFPASLNRAEINAFTAASLETIHQQFFAAQNTLSRVDRLNFIEIFYQFLFMKLISMVKPASLSFTCKDAIDTGEATACGFYAFLKMLEGKPWSAQDKEFFLWMLYAPALLIRERLIDVTRFTRMVNASSMLRSQQQLGDFGKVDLKPAA